MSDPIDPQKWMTVKPALVPKYPILEKNRAVEHAGYCSVIPEAATAPSDLTDWCYAQGGKMMLGYHYLDQHYQLPVVNAEICNDNLFTFGIHWVYGGRWNNWGCYIMEAYAYARVDSVSSIDNFSATAEWSGGAAGEESPVLHRKCPTASLECTITVNVSTFGIDEYEATLGFVIFGDGSGRRTYGPEFSKR